MLNKMGARPQGGRVPGRQPPPRQPSTTGPNDRPMKCINCGGTDHLTRACQKPEVPKDKRPCWKCGKPVHLGRDCRGGGATKLVDDEASDAPVFFGAVDYVGGDDEGYFKEHWQIEKRKTKPRPRGATLASFIDKNTFEMLEEREALANEPKAGVSRSDFSHGKCHISACISCINSFSSAGLDNPSNLRDSVAEEFPLLSTPTATSRRSSSKRSTASSAPRSSSPSPPTPPTGQPCPQTLESKAISSALSVEFGVLQKRRPSRRIRQAMEYRIRQIDLRGIQ